MIYFFYGADSYRLRQKANSVIAGYKAKHQSGLNFGRFDFSQDGDFEKFKNFADAYSMFEEKKLAVADNLVYGKKDEQEKFLEYMAKTGLAKSTEIFVLATQLLELHEERRGKQEYIFKSNKELFQKLVKASQGEEFALLDGVRLENWIKKQAQEKGLKIDNDAAKKLALSAGSDLWQLENELEKLTAYAAGKIASAKDVEALVKAKLESDIFQTIDALAQRNKQTAFKHLHKHLAQGEPEIYLLTMLVYQFRNLLLVKSQIEKGVPFYELGKKLKLHPFVLRKTFEQSKNFSLDLLKKIYERLLETDMGIKSGQIEPRTGLDLLIGEIAR